MLVSSASSWIAKENRECQIGTYRIIYFTDKYCGINKIQNVDINTSYVVSAIFLLDYEVERQN